MAGTMGYDNNFYLVISAFCTNNNRFRFKIITCAIRRQSVAVKLFCPDAGSKMPGSEFAEFWHDFRTLFNCDRAAGSKSAS